LGWVGQGRVGVIFLFVGVVSVEKQFHPIHLSWCYNCFKWFLQPAGENWIVHKKNFFIFVFFLFFWTVKFLIKVSFAAEKLASLH